MEWGRVVVAMPAYNEHDGIVDFIDEIERHLRPLCDNLQFVIIDDASRTPIGPVLLKRSSRARVSVTRNTDNLGHGPSVLLAYQEALALAPDAIIHVDGDGQFYGEDFPNLLGSLRDHDVVLGARLARNDPWFRVLISRSLRALIADKRIVDVNTPLRAYRPAALEALLGSVPEHSVVPHIHFSLRAHLLQHRLGTVFVRHRDRLGATVQGTSWGPRHHKFVPPRRLVEFSIGALLELHRTRRNPVGAKEFRPASLNEA